MHAHVRRPRAHSAEPTNGDVNKVSYFFPLSAALHPLHWGGKKSHLTRNAMLLSWQKWWISSLAPSASLPLLECREWRRSKEARPCWREGRDRKATAAFLFCVAWGKGPNELMLPDSDLVRFLRGINRMRGKTAKLLAFARRVFSASSFRVLLVPERWINKNQANEKLRAKLLLCWTSRWKLKRLWHFFFFHFIWATLNLKRRLQQWEVNWK